MSDWVGRRCFKLQLKSRTTLLQSAELQEKHNAFYCRIQKWQDVQNSYMPAVSQLCGEHSSEHDSLCPEGIPLYLPSSNPTLSGSLAEKEKRLRVAQLEDSLRELRRLLRVTMGLWEYKYTQLGPSQRAGTWARSLISRFQGKIDRCAERYRAARAALVSLKPEGSVLQRYLELKQEDVRNPGRGDQEVSEGRREVSWIWMVRVNDGDVGSEEEISNSGHFYHIIIVVPLTSSRSTH